MSLNIKHLNVSYHAAYQNIIFALKMGMIVLSALCVSYQFLSYPNSNAFSGRQQTALESEQVGNKQQRANMTCILL